MFGLYIESACVSEYVVSEGAFNTVYGDTFAVAALIALVLAGVRADTLMRNSAQASRVLRAWHICQKMRVLFVQ